MFNFSRKNLILNTKFLSGLHKIKWKGFFENNYFFLLTHQQLIGSYIYLGFHKFYLNSHLSNFILGTYYSLSIINTYKLLNVLRKNLLFILKNSLKNFMTIFVICEDYSLYRYFLLSYKNLDIDYFFGLWWGGLLRNFWTINFHKPFRYKLYNFKYGRLPGFIFYINMASKTRPLTLKSVADELKSVNILNLLIFDTNINSKYYDNWIFSNTINFYSCFFWLRTFECLGMKIFFLRKKKFLLQVLRKAIYNNEKTI